MAKIKVACVVFSGTRCIIATVAAFMFHAVYNSSIVTAALMRIVAVYVHLSF